MPEEVIREDAEQPVVPAEGQGKDDKVTIDKSQFESLQRELREAKQSEQAWARIARNGNAPLAEQPVVEEDELDTEQFVDADAADVPDDDTADKMVADIAAEGAKALSKRGYVTAAQAQRIAVEAAKAVAKEVVGRRERAITTDAKIMNKFPELRDQKSELFKETAARFQEAVDLNPKSAKDPGALYLAAKSAKEFLDAKNPPRRRSDEDFEDETDRQLRARSQDHRPTGRVEIDDDDFLGNEAKQVIAGMGITDEQFKASRKELAGSRRRR